MAYYPPSESILPLPASSSILVPLLSIRWPTVPAISTCSSVDLWPEDFPGSCLTAVSAGFAGAIAASPVLIEYGNRVEAKSIAEAQLFFERFERVVHDRTVTGAVDKLPHAAGDGAGAAHHVREALAGIGAGVIHGAVVAVEEDAAGLLGAAQNTAFVFAFGGVIGHKADRRYAQIASQTFDIAIRDGDGRDPAAVGALGAIDLIFDALSDAAEDAVGVVVRLHEAAELEILVALLLTEEADLHEAGEHHPSVDERESG